jgi:regulator of RNase E activity RraB
MKAFVVMNQGHQPDGVYLIPEIHTAAHYISQLNKAAEEVGRYGLMVDVYECGALGAADNIRKMIPEVPPR